MCDYSLHNVASRLARLGDKLVTTEFPCTTTRGFAAIVEPTVAVCLQPGTELAFDRELEYWQPFTGPSKAKSRVARFRQVNPGRRDTHHDALEFSDGTIVLVTRLCPGQCATVLQLPADVHSMVLPDDHEHSAQGIDVALGVRVATRLRNAAPALG
jgi:hypothetical protein